MATGTWKRPSRCAPIDTPGEAHVGRDDDMARLRLDDARHGDADGREVGRFQLGLGEHFLDHRFDHRQDLLRPAGPRRRLPLLPQDGPRFADQRGLNLRAADIHAQIQPFANRFRFHCELLSVDIARTRCVSLEAYPRIGLVGRSRI